MLIAVIIVLGVLFVASAYANYNLYTKYSTLEETAEENVNFILSLRSRVLSQRSYLKQLDRKGAFEADDEVGYFFKELKKIINDIAFYLELEPEESEQEAPQSVRSRITSEF